MNIKNKTVIVLGLLALSIASCGSKNETKQEDSLSNESAYAESTSVDDEDLESKEETESNPSSLDKSTTSSQSSEEVQETLTEEEKAVIDQLVINMEEFENGTAGSSLKADIMLTDFLNQASFLDDKLDQAKEYFTLKSSEVSDVDNFNQSLETLKGKIEFYKSDEENFLKEVEASGSEWKPQTSMENFEEFLDI